MAPKKLEQLAGANTPEDLADIQPLLNNSWFAKQAQQEIELTERAAEAAAASAAKTEDFRTATQQFSTAMRSLRALGKRFPEIAQYTDEAIKHLQQAMNFAGYNATDAQAQQLREQGQMPQPPAAGQTGQSVNPSQQTPYQTVPPAQQPGQPGVVAGQPTAYPNVPPTPQQAQSAQAGQPAQSAWAGGPQPTGPGGAQPSPGTGTPGTYTVQGSISPADKANGAIVTISGPMNRTTNADASGNFSFSGLVNGDYTVQAIKFGVTFMPNTQPVRVQSNSPAPVQFTAS
jgi:hypothetical protein